MVDTYQKSSSSNAPYCKRLPSPPKYNFPPLLNERPKEGHLQPSWESELPPGFDILPQPYAQWEYRYRHEFQHVAPSVILGPSSIAKEPELLKQMNISCVLIARRTTRDFAARVTPTSLRICREAGVQTELIDVEDYQQLASRFAATSAFLDGFVQAQPTFYVFVCCESGNDISAAIVVAHIMTRYQVSMTRAIQLVQLRRFCVSISEELQRLLDSYQAIVRARLDLAMTTTSTLQKRGIQSASESQNNDSERFSSRTFVPFSDN